MQTHEPPSNPKIFTRTTTQFHGMEADIEVGFGINVLDLVDPRFQSSLFEEGGKTTGGGHDWRSLWR